LGANPTSSQRAKNIRLQNEWADKYQVKRTPAAPTTQYAPEVGLGVGVAPVPTTPAFTAGRGAGGGGGTRPQGTTLAEAWPFPKTW